MLKFRPHQGLAFWCRSFHVADLNRFSFVFNRAGVFPQFVVAHSTLAEMRGNFWAHVLGTGVMPMPSKTSSLVMALTCSGPTVWDQWRWHLVERILFLGHFTGNGPCHGVVLVLQFCVGFGPQFGAAGLRTATGRCHRPADQPAGNPRRWWTSRGLRWPKFDFGTSNFHVACRHVDVLPRARAVCVRDVSRRIDCLNLNIVWARRCGEARASVSANVLLRDLNTRMLFLTELDRDERNFNAKSNKTMFLPQFCQAELDRSCRWKGADGLNPNRSPMSMLRTTQRQALAFAAFAHFHSQPATLGSRTPRA